MVTRRMWRCQPEDENTPVTINVIPGAITMTERNESAFPPDGGDASDFDRVAVEVAARLRPICGNMSEVCFSTLVADVVTFKLKWSPCNCGSAVMPGHSSRREERWLS